MQGVTVFVDSVIRPSVGSASGNSSVDSGLFPNPQVNIDIQGGQAHLCA